MGNSYCSVCERQVESGKYCDRCYMREFPSCGYCKKPLLRNQDIVGGYHKFPCYSQKSRMCCQCDAPVDYNLNGTYCRNCYDSKYPPPPRVHARSQDHEMTLYLRDDEFNSKVHSLARSFGRGLRDGGQQRFYLVDH